MRRKQYEEAYSLYTQALSDEDPLSAILYANRAQAALSLQRFRFAKRRFFFCLLRFHQARRLLLNDWLREAEMDAGVALSLDGKFAKAYYRRAQARVGLRKWEEARFDVETLLKVAKDDVATTKTAQKLLEEIRAAGKPKVVEETPIVVPKKVEVVEKPAEPESKPAVVAAPVATAAPAAVPAMPLPKLALTAPKTAFELEATMSHLRNDPSSLAEYVAMLSEASLPSMLGNALTEPLLSTFCSAMGHESFVPAKGIALLRAVQRVPRSEMVILFLGDETKRRFAALFDSWKARGVTVPPELSSFVD